MTSAKPQLMAAQTDAPDDLIAELARLMADDAKSNPPQAREQGPAVRIPGGVSPAPAPRFDFPASNNAPVSPAPAFSLRIPGGVEAAQTAVDAGAAKPEGEPFNFDFGLSPKPAVPSAVASAPAIAPAPSPQAAKSIETTVSVTNLAPAPTAAPKTVAVESPAPELDQDSLADLIAAELAVDLDPPRKPDVDEQSVPATTAQGGAHDRFGVAPVFGLGAPALPVHAPVSADVESEEFVAPVSTPEVQPVAVSPVPPEASLDPLDEIERLVGPAVRMNVASAASAPSLALRSLATPVVPELSHTPPKPVSDVPVSPEPVPPAPRSTEPVNSVDEAILAAAAATGAHVEWVNAGGEGVAVDEERVAPTPRAPRMGGLRLNRAVAGPLVAVGLLAVAGGGLYWMLGQGGATTGPAPLLVADTTPTKEVPEADATTPAPQSIVFNEISGTDTGAEEQIVSRDQADTEAVVAATTATPGTGVIADAGNTTVDPNQDGLVNRKVRTVTVRPDGTIVSGEDSLAGSAILPVDRPNVPEVPGAETGTPDLIASVTAEAEAAAAAEAATPAAPSVPAAEPGSNIAVVDAAGAQLAGRTVRVPMQRPSDFASIASAAVAAANAAPALAPLPATTPVAVAPTPVAAAPSGTAAAYVQMASQRSEADAQQTAQAVSTRYGVLFGGAAPEVHRVDLGERGIYYRVLVPAPSRESAANICTNVKAAGGDCLLL